MANVVNLLLVDDYEVNLELLEAYLERSEIPMRIYKAYTGAEAYAIIEQTPLDLILLDVMLPDTSGYDICRSLKSVRLYQNIPIIILTALNDKKSMLEGLQAGADEFLTKPVDAHELILRVKNLLKLKTIANDLDSRYRQLRNELTIATQLQKSFLPKAVPVYDRLELEVLYEPSSFIGGDYYDFLEIDRQRLGILICDVKGHGVASAMITATIKFQLQDLRAYYGQPAQLLNRLNQRLEQFFSSTGNDYFVTAFYGVLDLEAGLLRYSNAGHTCPYLCTQQEALALDTASGLPLGILAEGAYEVQQVAVHPGDELFFYTDGIFEMPWEQGQQSRCVCLEDLFDQGRVGQTQIYQLQQVIRQHVRQYPITDDINYIWVKIRPQRLGPSPQEE